MGDGSGNGTSACGSAPAIRRWRNAAAAPWTTPARDLAAEARKAARKSRETSKPAKPERRERAERFLKDALAHGPKRVSDVEEAAEKARIDMHALEQARGDLGIVTSRSNAGGVQAVQWSLPG